MNTSFAEQSLAQVSKQTGLWGISHKLVRILPLWLSMICAGCSSLPEPWLEYTDTFLEGGRIIDTGNGHISHSEGQGYGMLLAFYYNDKQRFETIWKWTKKNLQVRNDDLFAWLWHPQSDTAQHKSPHIKDLNNATDGDLLIGYALTLAGEQWQRPDYLSEAEAISESILEQLTVSLESDKTLLLPAAYGFKKDGRIAFNPSYQITAAYRAFKRLTHNPNWQSKWQAIQQNSLGIIHQHLLPTSELAPDWISLSEHSQNEAIKLIDQDNLSDLWPGKNKHFGDEAIRVYLYQLWQAHQPYRADYLLNHFKQNGHIPRYVKASGEVSNQEAMAGYYAILAMNAKRQHQTQLAQQLLITAQHKLESEKQDYYSHTLFLLAINSEQKVAP